MSRLADDYGIDVPVIGAGMAFVGLPNLAAAVSNAGGLGVLGASPLPPPHLLWMIRQTRALTGRPFGVNLINAKGPSLASSDSDSPRLIIQRAVEDEFDAWLGRARYERRPDPQQRGLR